MAEYDQGVNVVEYNGGYKHGRIWGINVAEYDQGVNMSV